MIISLEERYENFKKTIQECGSYLLTESDDTIKHNLFEEFSIDAISFLHEDTLNLLFSIPLLALLYIFVLLRLWYYRLFLHNILFIFLQLKILKSYFTIITKWIIFFTPKFLVFKNILSISAPPNNALLVANTSAQLLTSFSPRKLITLPIK